MDNRTKTEYLENTSKGKTIKCYCNICGKDINHTVLMDYYESYIERPYNDY
jgi:hypothetical protein